MGDRIIEIDGQDFSQKTLAQATLALSAAVPLMRLTVMRQIEDDGEGGVLDWKLGGYCTRGGYYTRGGWKLVI